MLPKTRPVAALPDEQHSAIAMRDSAAYTVEVPDLAWVPLRADMKGEGPPDLAKRVRAQLENLAMKAATESALGGTVLTLRIDGTYSALVHIDHQVPLEVMVDVR